MKTIAFFGECMIEKNSDVLTVSGDTYNTAVYLRRLADEASLKVFYVTAVGVDNVSHYMNKQFTEQALDTSYVLKIEDKSVGQYAINLAVNGERSFEYDRDDSAVRRYFDQADTAFEQALYSKSFDYVYLSGISLAILSPEHCARLLAALKVFKQRGGEIVFDNNYRDLLWQGKNTQFIYNEIMAICTLALLTDEDEYAVYGEQNIKQIISRCQALNINEVVIKRGELPCVINTDEQYMTVTGIPVANVVDTCAAGDSFAAGYLHQRIIGNAPKLAAQAGHLMASEVIQHHGAIIPVSDMPQTA